MVLLQIFCLESLFYLSFVASTVFVDTLFGFRFGLSKFFDATQFSFEDAGKAALCLTLWGSLLFVAFWMPRIIERTRKCLDFVVTICFLHLIFSTIFVAFPSRFSFWLVWVVGAVTSTLLGEHLCMVEERKEIPTVSMELGAITS